MKNEVESPEIGNTDWTNPSVLKWARERLGLSLENVDELSHKLGKNYSPIKANELHRWENREAQPDLERLETLSEIYVCPVGYFFLDKPPEEPLALSFRGLAPEKKEALKPLTQQTLRRFLQLAEWTIFTIEKLGIEWKVGVEFEEEGGRRRNKADIDSMVERERKRLGFSPVIRKNWKDANQAFLWWRRKIEELGIFCSEMKLEPGDIRGAAKWVRSHYPFILVNHQDIETAQGRIFTLLHEYYHLLTAEEGIVCDFRGLNPRQGPEPHANRFAAGMLISRFEVESRLREINKFKRREWWSDSVLDKIRQPLFVSRDVIAIILQEMDLAPKDLYLKKRRQWEKGKPWGRGGKGRPTNKELKFQEIGFSLTRVLSKPAKETSVPLDDLSYVLDMKIEKIPEFFSWARQEVL